MIGTVLFNIFIEPLEMLFEMVFSVAYNLVENPLLVLIAMSVVVNLVALPLYNRADSIQQEENERQQKMSRWVGHIKKTFKGDERYMMLTTYYRQQGYKTWYSLRSSFSLILQIPFFIAAYDYLSNLDALKNMSFWVFESLGKPDGLLQIGGVSINVMPIIMTLINVVASYIYLRGATKTQKIQTYALAAFFLVFLYTSPAGLVIYWTFNQVFSLVKNIFTKLVKSRIILGLFISALGVAVFLGVLLSGHAETEGKLALIIVILLVCQIPLEGAILKRKGIHLKNRLKPVGTRTYLAIVIYLTIFMGAIIPLSVISSSPEEFVAYGNTPLQIVIYTLSAMAGVFIIWCGVYYYLGREKLRNVFTYVLFVLAGVFTVDFFFFGQGLGTLSDRLVFDRAPEFSETTMVVNILVLAGVAAVCVLVMRLLSKKMFYVMTVFAVASVGLCITQSGVTSEGLKAADVNVKKIKVSEAKPLFNLSRNGKNVLIIMMDRGISAYEPFIFHEKPELKKSFEGFTYYPNTLSFGDSTNFCIPSIYGGYEYSMVEINKRADELLKDKHNEALLTMPSIFRDNGFNVTVTDPAYVNYKTVSDLSLYDDQEGINVYKTIGRYELEDSDDISFFNTVKKVQNRNFFFYSFMKALPEVLQSAVYDEGNYFSMDDNFYSTNAFADNYAVLSAAPRLTGITDDSENNYIFFENELTHAPSVLTWDDYRLGILTRDELFSRIDEYSLNGIKMKMDSSRKIEHYMCNMATYMKLAEWFDYLRKQGVWDNTRIIIVADHGKSVSQGGQFDNLMIDGRLDIQACNPILMVKDFNAKEYKVSDEFMTTADVPVLAFKDLIKNPVNPFTGKEINDVDKTAHVQYYTNSQHYRPNTDNPSGKLFNTSDGQWWSVHDNIFDENNWKYVKEGDEGFTGE